jgi:hypothetical protein
MNITVDSIMISAHTSATTVAGISPGGGISPAPPDAATSEAFAMADRHADEAWSPEATVENVRTLLLDGRLLDPPEGIRPVLRRLPSEPRTAIVWTAAVKDGNR